MYAGFHRFGRRSLRPAINKLVLFLAVLETRRGCKAIDIDAAPHWLHRDLGIRDGRPTRQELRRPPKWPERR